MPICLLCDKNQLDMKWINEAPEKNQDIEQICTILNHNEPFPTPLAGILYTRGIRTEEQLKHFFGKSQNDIHSPFLMHGMERAVQRIIKAIDHREKILIYGDYDVDGTTAVSLFKLVLSDLDVDFETYIPDRYTEGYGLSFKGVDYADQIGAKLLITLDCGTKAIEKVAMAKERGIEVIICDHHTPGEVLPEAHTLLNPQNPLCNYQNKNLTGCGVGYKLLDAVIKTLQQEARLDPDYEILDLYGELIALSIACDIVPITGENRSLVKTGIDKIRRDPLPGLRSLMQLSPHPRKWDVSDLVFFIGPRINAAGRLESADSAVQLLTSANSEMAAPLAQHLNKLNEIRKNEDAAITEEALELVHQYPSDKEQYSHVLSDEHWKKGLIGIVASRVIEHSYKPTIMLTKSEPFWVGSGRSIAGFNLYKAVEACSDHLVQFGGHEFAVGLTIREEEIPNFRSRFEGYAKEHLRKSEMVPRISIASEVDFSYLLERFVRLVKRMGPFGPGNMEPVFATRNVVVKGAKILKEKHVRMELSQGEKTFEAIGFGLAEKWMNAKTTKLHIAYQVDFKTWRGETYIQLKLKDIKNASDTLFEQT